MLSLKNINKLIKIQQVTLSTKNTGQHIYMCCLHACLKQTFIQYVLPVICANSYQTEGAEGDIKPWTYAKLT